MKLKFLKSKGKPKKGMFVALHNCFPVESKGSLGLIVEIKKLLSKEIWLYKPNGDIYFKEYIII